MSNAFTEAQKQYLSGFALGADVARAVRGLPILAGSGGAPGTTVTVGPGRSTPAAKGPDELAVEAQNAVLARGEKLSKEEQAKRDKNALDLWPEMEARAEQSEFPKGTDVFLQKFHGLFYVAPAQNAYMCRLRLPGGALRAEQLAGLADLADNSAGGYCDVTTRANLQLREIPADQAMDILYGLRQLDIINLGSGADNIRNITASPVSGFDRTELIETLPYARRMHHYILNHREMYGLPRKFNIAFDGGGRISALDDTNDIGFRAVRVPEHAATAEVPSGVYFQLCLGGITGHRDFARDTGVLVPPQQATSVAGAIIRVFARHGDRTDRKRARLKYLLDDWGFDKFLAAVEQELARPLLKAASDQWQRQTGEDRQAHIGFHEQKDGRYYAGIVLPVGRLQSDQMRGIAHLAENYGSGEVRLTVWQNLIIPDIEAADIAAVQEAITAMGLGVHSSSFRAGLVACTGNAGCKFAASNTKSHALQLSDYLQARIELDVPINIHLTGCHHSCAQHYIGDIGLLATQVEQGDDMVEGYHLHVGGGWGSESGIARLLVEAVAFHDLPPMVEQLVRLYLQQRASPEESFAQFTRRKTDDELKTALEPLAAAI